MGEEVTRQPPVDYPDPVRSLESRNAEDISNLKAELETLKQELRDSANIYDYLHKRFDGVGKQIMDINREREMLEREQASHASKLDVLETLRHDYRMRFPETFNCKKCGARISEHQKGCRTCGSVQ